MKTNLKSKQTALSEKISDIDFALARFPDIERFETLILCLS